MLSRNIRFALVAAFCFQYLVGCGGNGGFGTDRWSQFHGDPQNGGFMASRSVPALTPTWRLEVGPVAHSSPTIGTDGTIYIGNLDGKLIAVNPNGTEKCSIDLSDGIILSTPAVAEDDTVYIISTRQLKKNTFSSTLHSVTSNCTVNWSYTFPSINNDIKGHTSASAKVLESNRGVHIFASVRTSRPRDDADNDDVEDGLNEIFVFNRSGNVIDRRTIGGCVSVSGGGSDISGALSDIWDFITHFPETSAEIGDAFGPLYEQFGWLDPTLAITTLSTLTSSDRPLVIVADNCLGLRLTGFHWQLGLSNPKLARIWTYDDDSRKRYYSSPAVFVNGLLVIGREDGLIQGFDPESGDKLWEQQVDEAVMATPASFGRQIFLNSLHRIHVLEANGEKVDVPAGSALLNGQSIASPALSANYAYFNSTGGMLTRSFNLLTRAKDEDASGGLASP
ncbi:MAG: hypothetical protein ACU85E_06165, partial [Gammaproteobacteria bacterium]